MYSLTFIEQEVSDFASYWESSFLKIPEPNASPAKDGFASYWNQIKGYGDEKNFIEWLFLNLKYGADEINVDFFSEDINRLGKIAFDIFKEIYQEIFEAYEANF